MKTEEPTPVKEPKRVKQFFATGLFYLICLVVLLPLILLTLFLEKLAEFSEFAADILSDFVNTARKNISVSLKANLWDEAVEALKENRELKLQLKVALEEETRLRKELDEKGKGE